MVLEDCIFHQISSFHATNNPSVDIMHDLFEGVLNYEIAIMLYSFIQVEKFFSLEDFNIKVHCFNYGEYASINKSQPVSIDNLKVGKLRYSASEIMWLTKFLGVLIGEWISYQNQKWQVFLLLKEISEIVLNDLVNENLVKRLQTLITEHHTFFKSLR